MLDQYPTVKKFLSELVPNLEIYLPFVLLDNDEVIHRFCQQVEVLLVCLTDQFYALSCEDKKTCMSVFQRVMHKIAKVIHYMQLMVEIKKLDIQISNKVRNSKQAKETNLDEKQREELQEQVDKQLVMSLKVFMHLINIENMVQAQQYINRNLHVLTFLMTNKDSTVLRRAHEPETEQD